MKRSILRLSFILAAMAIVLSLPAQATLSCGEGPAEFTTTLEPPLCYPKTDYDERWKAINQFTIDVLGFVSCTNNCPLPNLFDCQPKFIRFTQGGPVTETDEAWCFSGEIIFEWKCTECTRKPRPVDHQHEGDEEPPEGGDLQDNPDLNYKFSDVEAVPESPVKGQIQSIYPNPSTGFFHTQILVQEDNSDIQLLLSDLAGNTILEKAYNDVSKSVFNTRNDLSDIPPGMYILKVTIDNVMVGTSKLSVVK